MTTEQKDHDYGLPIIIMGLPNSGSRDLHDFFECSELTSRHYCCGGTTKEENNRSEFPCFSVENSSAYSGKTTSATATCGKCVLNNMKNQKAPFENCHDDGEIQVWASFDLETRDEWFLPQQFAIGLLHQGYPDATWILNQRSTSLAWAESMLHWNSKTQRLFASYKLPFYPHHIPDAPTKVENAEEVVKDMERVLTERVYNQTEHLRKLTLLQQVYDNHTSMIRRWASQFPSHHLIELNVDNEDTGEVLQEFLTSISDDGVISISRIQDRVHDTDCSWNFNPPDQDWTQFRLRF